ncbi:hypothetical protein [Candidatus Harpocratesius sp.]
MGKVTIHIKEHLLIQAKDAVAQGFAKSVSSLIGNALQEHLKRIKKEQIKKALENASKDPLFLSDIEEITKDFKYTDYNE